MRPRWRARRAWAAGSTRSCRPASSRSPASLPREEAIAQIKHAIDKTYSKRGAEVVKRNFEAVDATLAHLHEVPVPVGRHRDARPSAAGIRAGARLRPADHGGAPGREGRPAAGERVSGGRHLAGRHGEMGEAEPRARDPGVGRGHLHPVQPVRAGVSACRHPRQGVRRRPARRRAADVQVGALQRARVQGAGSTRFRWRRRTAPAATCA